MDVSEAFDKFRGKISRPTQKEQNDASRRQQEIRSHMNQRFKLETDFLTGSYKRWTKTKPLKDVDIFCVMHEDERAYRQKAPSVLLGDVEKLLVEKYGSANVHKQRRSVSVDFSASDDEQVMSFDVVPAFTKGDHYEMPDLSTVAGWTETNPKIHEEEALEKQRSYSNKWRGLVRMIKTWNRHHDKPVKPSFFLEVMAMELFVGDFGGDYRRELQGFFASAAGRVHDVWPEPAGLGSPVSDGMTTAQKDAAKTALLDAERMVATAIRLEGERKTGEALRTWRQIFGNQFPVS